MSTHNMHHSVEWLYLSFLPTGYGMVKLLSVSLAGNLVRAKVNALSPRDEYVGVSR